ncbi:MAG: NAD(P)/FAD-dependent oxidoreductase [Pseudomonadota bacterium]
MDVAIIGTGPAAGAASAYLANTGLKVVVLEQAELPRSKACGGLVPMRTLDMLPLDVSDLVDHTVENRAYFCRHIQGETKHTPEAVLALVDRAKFDSTLISRAISESRGDIHMQQGFRVSDVDETDASVQIRSASGQRVQARYVIGADGASSRTARCLGLNDRKINAVGIDMEVSVTADCFRGYRDAVTFDYFCLPAGYGWVFPKSDNLLSVGVASWDKRANCNAAMESYLSHAVDADERLCSNRSAHPIPVYNGAAHIASQRVCLVGDAASLVDPVTGEGIRFALHSGMIAATTICELLRGETEEAVSGEQCQLYQRRVYQMAATSLEPQLRFASLPYRDAPDFYYRKFVTGDATKAYL